MRKLVFSASQHNNFNFIGISCITLDNTSWLIYTIESLNDLRLCVIPNKLRFQVEKLSKISRYFHTAKHYLFPNTSAKKIIPQLCIFQAIYNTQNKVLWVLIGGGKKHRIFGILRFSIPKNIIYRIFGTIKICNLKIFDIYRNT